MAFTRRHYIQIAAMLAWERIKAENAYEMGENEKVSTIERQAAMDAIQSIELNLAGMFADDNPNFRAPQFHRAAHNLSAREVTS